MNSELASIERPQFALRLEDGRGQLVLNRRRIGDMIDLEQLAMSMRDVPQRLDLSSGVERFRHSWARLETLQFSIDDLAMTRFLRHRLSERPLKDLEVRVSGGDIFVAGELTQGEGAPFLVRLRVEPAGAPSVQSVIISAFSAAIYAPHEVPAPVLAGWLLGVFEPNISRQGCSLAVVNPLPALMAYIFSELGWKIPGIRGIAFEQISVEAGRMSVRLSRPESRLSQVSNFAVGRASDARFLADYEAKLLFEDSEHALWLGEFERVVTNYERQLESHPRHPFLVKRLMQIHIAGRSGSADARILAGLLERQNGPTIDSKVTLAISAINESRPKLAAEHYAEAVALAEANNHGLEISQLQCARATCLESFDLEGAEKALASALGYRRRLPGALRRLSTLQAAQERWHEAIRTRERLLLDEESAESRFSVLTELGKLALEKGTASQAAEFYARATQLAPSHPEASRGLGRAYLAQGQTLSAIRSLDQSVRQFQERQESESAADLLVEIGDIWQVQDEGTSSAIMRFRQALAIRPGHAGALIGISESASASGDLATAREALEELLRAAENGQSTLGRFEAMRHLGEFLLDDKDTESQAVPFLQRCLDGPASVALDASRLLEDYFRKSQRWTDLARHLEGMLKKSSMVDHVPFRLELSELINEKLNDGHRALTVLMAVEANGNLPLLRARASLQRVQHRYVPLERTLAALADSLTDPLEIAAVQSERGDVLRFELNRSDLAIEAYGSAVACANDQERALRGLVDLYREQERYGELAGTIKQLIDLTEGNEQVDLLTELSRVLREQLGQVESAYQSIQRAVALDPREPAVIRGLLETQRALGDDEEALKTFERLHQLYELEGYEENPADFKISIGKLCETLNRKTKALTWFQAALKHDVNRIEAYEYAQDLMLSAEGLASTLTFLEGFLERELNDETNLFLRLRIGRLAWRELREAERAFAVLNPVSSQSGVNEEVLGLLLEMATAMEDWPQVGRLLEQRLGRVSQTQRPSVLMHLASLSLTELNQPQQARQFAEAALKEDATFVPALVLLSELAYEDRRWEKVESLVEQLSQVEGYALTAEDLFRRAVAALHCGSPGHAISSLRIVEMMGAYFPGMWGAFVEGYLQMGDFLPVGRVVDRMVEEEADDLGTLGLLRRCMSIDGVVLSESANAFVKSVKLQELVADQEVQQPPIVDAFAETRQLDEALVKEVNASIDAAPMSSYDEQFTTGEFASWQPSDSDDKGAPMASHEVPEREDPDQGEVELALAATGKLDVGEVALVESEATNAAHAATGSLSEEVQRLVDADVYAQSGVIASTSPRVSDTDQIAGGQEAMDTTSAKEPARPGKDDAQDEAFLEFVRKMPSEQELAEPESESESILAQIETSSDAREQADLWLTLAELRRDRLFNPALALEAFWQVINIGEPTSESWREAVEALEDIYAIDNDWNQLVKLLDIRIESGSEDPLEVELIKAATLRSANRLSEAKASAEKAIELGERSVDLLVDILVRQGDETEAAERLVENADLLGGVVGDDYRLRAAQFLAPIQPERALAQLALINNKEVRQDGLDLHLKLARKLNAFAVLPDLLADKSALCPRDASGGIRASQYLLSAGEVCRDELEDLERACGYFADAVGVWAENVDALVALRTCREALGDLVGVAECIEQEISLSLAGNFRGLRRLALAELTANALEDKVGARALVELALEELEDEGDRMRANALLADIDGGTDAVLTSDSVVEALTRTETFANASESMSAKVERLETALGLDPTQFEAYSELADLYRENQQYEELSTVLERHSTVVSADQVRAELLLERAGIVQDHLRDTALAKRLWERVIDFNDSSLASTRFALISLLSANPRRVDLERLLEKLNRRIEESGGAKRAGLLSLRAELWHRHLGETNRAREDLEAAIRADEYHSIALFALARIAMGRGELTDASAWVRDALHSPEINDQVTVVKQVLNELKSAFQKQDEAEEWGLYIDSLRSEHADGELVGQLIASLARSTEDS